VVESVKRGDVDGSSFMFIPTETTWRDETHEGRTVSIREIKAVELFEVGPVTFPAYEATSARSTEGSPERRHQEWLTHHVAEARSEHADHKALVALNTPEARKARGEAMDAMKSRLS
jgi:phage head maturation protease